MSNEHGFTLLETMVALAILGLLALALAGALRLGGRAWDLNYQRVEHSQQTRAAQDLLRRVLSQAHPARLNAGENGHIAFSGDAGEVVVIAPMPAHLALGAYDVLRVGTVRGESGTLDLVAFWDRFAPDAPRLSVGADSRRVTLVEDIEDARFTYFGSDEPGTEPVWSQDWHHRRALPGLVRLRMDFADGSRRTWPDFVVRTMVDTAAVTP